MFGKKYEGGLRGRPHSVLFSTLSISKYVQARKKDGFDKIMPYSMIIIFVLASHLTKIYGTNNQLTEMQMQRHIGVVIFVRKVLFGAKLYVNCYLRKYLQVLVNLFFFF